MKRTIFFISDGTGITAETLGHSLITQFEDIDFESVTIPYVNTLERAQDALKKIKASHLATGIHPIIFATLVEPSIRQVFEGSDGIILDLFKTFLDPLEQELNAKSSYTIGKSHSLANGESYNTRIEATNFALANDDGLGTHNYQLADTILIGVSRCGKTPTCLYLALQFGIRAANYPLTEDDLKKHELPECLQAYQEKLFGLSIDPERLHDVREERRPDSRYASLERCRIEVAEVEDLYRHKKIPFLNTTTRSIEEISTKLLAKSGIQRRLL